MADGGWGHRKKPHWVVCQEIFFRGVVWGCGYLDESQDSPTLEFGAPRNVSEEATEGLSLGLLETIF